MELTCFHPRCEIISLNDILSNVSWIRPQRPLIFFDVISISEKVTLPRKKPQVTAKCGVKLTTSMAQLVTNRLRCKRCRFNSSKGTNIYMVCKYLFRVWVLWYHGTRIIPTAQGVLVSGSTMTLLVWNWCETTIIWLTFLGILYRDLGSQATQRSY